MAKNFFVTFYLLIVLITKQLIFSPFWALFLKKFFEKIFFSVFYQSFSCDILWHYREKIQVAKHYSRKSFFFQALLNILCIYLLSQPVFAKKSLGPFKLYVWTWWFSMRLFWMAATMACSDTDFLEWVATSKFRNDESRLSSTDCSFTTTFLAVFIRLFVHLVAIELMSSTLSDLSTSDRVGCIFDSDEDDTVDAGDKGGEAAGSINFSCSNL